MSLTWYATNNTAMPEDAADLEALGIRVLAPSRKPIKVFRDADTGRLLAELGSVTVQRDGEVLIRPREGVAAGPMTVLLRTALDCVERDMHKRDRWEYRRATSERPGRWVAEILTSIPEGNSLFAAHVTALLPASAPMRTPYAQPLHERA